MQHLLDIKQTQIEMVRDRGFPITVTRGDEIGEMDILTMDQTQFAAYIVQVAGRMGLHGIDFTNLNIVRSVMNRLYDILNEAGQPVRRMLVYYTALEGPQQTQIPVTAINAFITKINEFRPTDAILIVNAQISSAGAQMLSALGAVRLQTFNESELTYNPIHHVSVPRHELLSPEEQARVMAEVKAGPTGWPIMRDNSPIARYYGWEVGQMVRVHRRDTAVSILADRSINYRLITSV